jgi:hypothetical protein
MYGMDDHPPNAREVSGCNARSRRVKAVDVVEVVIGTLGVTLAAG